MNMAARKSDHHIHATCETGRYTEVDVIRRLSSSAATTTVDDTAPYHSTVV